MRYRQLGRTGLTVSEIGFGAWGIGGPSPGLPAYGPTDDRESRLSLRRAYELGVTLYDTSDLYGHGHSEVLIGEALKEFRHDLILATKVGLSGGGTSELTGESAVLALEASLKRLQTDYIDLYQLHSPSLDVLRRDPSIVGSLQDLVRAGKVRAAGISVRSPDDGLLAVNEFGFESVQVNFNMSDQRARCNGLFDLCLKAGTGVIVRTPLSFGFLTQAYTSRTNFDATDHRSGWPKEQLKKWAGAGHLFTGHETNGQTSAQVALRYCLSFPCVASAIPGMLSRAHVEENVRAGDMGPLPAEQLDRFSEIYLENQFYVGRSG